MTPPSEYQFYAQECLRWADETDSEEHRQAFLEMARMWTQLALQDIGKVRQPAQMASN